MSDFHRVVLSNPNFFTTPKYVCHGASDVEGQAPTALVVSLPPYGAYQFGLEIRSAKDVDAFIAEVIKYRDLIWPKKP